MRARAKLSACSRTEVRIQSNALNLFDPMEETAPTDRKRVA
jgi:hypothetical protein